MLFGYDDNLNNLYILRSPDLTTGSSFSTFTTTLDTWTFDSGSWDIANLDQINLSIQESGFFPLDEFGNDAGNFIYLDNMSLTQIPDPSTVLLLTGAFAFLATCWFRRKKSV